MKTTYYEKVNGRYKPVAEYDSNYCDSFPQGTHLVICNPNGTSRRFNVDPAFAPMIAAGRFAEDVISRAIVDASDIRPGRSPITPEQRAAWMALSESFGEDAHMLTWPSAREAAETAVVAMAAEANKTLQNPAVKLAYENFLTVYQLCCES